MLAEARNNRTQIITLFARVQCVLKHKVKHGFNVNSAWKRWAHEARAVVSDAQYYFRDNCQVLIALG
jgi:hypothetical protein